jgi:hypothetical protein
VAPSSDGTFSYTQRVTVAAKVTLLAGCRARWQWQGAHDCLEATPGQDHVGDTCTFALEATDEGNGGLAHLRSYATQCS